MNSQELAVAIRHSIAAKRPMLIRSSPGIGKSSIIAQVAEEEGYELHDVRASQLDPVDLRGLPVLDNGLTKWFPPNFLPHSDSKKKHLVFFDELMLAPPLVLAACYQLILDRKLGDYTLPDGAALIAASNLKTDKAMVGNMPTPLANRFIHATLEVDNQMWKEWAYHNGIRQEIISFLEWSPQYLMNFDPMSKDDAFATPRSWHMASDLLRSEMPSSVESEMICGTIGSGVGNTFLGFKRMYESLPDIQRIIKEPDKVKVPNKVDVSYATVGALVAHSNKQNIDKIVQYIRRMDVEFGILFLKDITINNPDMYDIRAVCELVNSKPYISAFESN